MKKISSYVIAIMLVITMIGCGSTPKEEVSVNVVGLKGATTMGMVEFMNRVDQEEEFEHDYNFDMIVATDEVTTKLIKGEIDIAAIPANLASVLYQKTEGQMQVIALNTLGVLYIVENGNSITDISSLKGKTIAAAGKGSTPEMALRYILSQNGIDPDKDVTIEWKSEQSECLTYITATEGAVAMMPEPFITTARLKNEQIEVRIDLTKEWDKIEQNKEFPSSMITGVVVARKQFVDENPNVIKDFLANYETSVSFVNENIEEAATLISNYDIIPYETALRAIENCNIVCIQGEEMKVSLEGYLKVLFEQNPASVGGAMPEEDFYYFVK